MTESSGATNYGSDQKKNDFQNQSDEKENHEKKASESFHEVSHECKEEIDRQAIDEVSRWS